MAKPLIIIDVFSYIDPNDDLKSFCYVDGTTGKLMFKTISELSEISGCYEYEPGEKEALELAPDVLAFDFNYINPILF